MEKVGLDVSRVAMVAALLDVCDAWPNAQEEFRYLLSRKGDRGPQDDYFRPFVRRLRQRCPPVDVGRRVALRTVASGGRLLRRSDRRRVVWSGYHPGAAGVSG